MQKESFKCDAILFDLDGVLIDSTVCITRHWQQWAAHHNLDLDRVMEFAHGIRTIETIRLVAPHLPAEEETKRFTAIEVVDTEGVVAIDGAFRLLGLIPPGSYAIVTSGSRELAQARLRHAGLPIPDVLVTADDVVQGKPSPEPYLLAVKRLGMAAKRCVVIEDAPAGVEAAYTAGIPVIAITTTHSREKLLKANAIIETLHALSVTSESGKSTRLLIQIE
jgi:sugar-phosphatase